MNKVNLCRDGDWREGALRAVRRWSERRSSEAPERKLVCQKWSYLSRDMWQMDCVSSRVRRWKEMGEVSGRQYLLQLREEYRLDV